MSIFDTIEQAVRDRQPTYPPERSAGGVNTFTVKGCKAVGYTPGYCVCLNKLMAFERDKGLASYPECDKAIRDKSCIAISMRQEEQTAGKALYFVDRALLREEMDKQFGQATASFRPTKAIPAAAPTTAPKKVEPKPAAKSDDRLMAMPTDGYAAAINAAIQEAAQQPKPAPKADVPPPSNKPMSLLDIARQQVGTAPKGE